MIFIRKNLPYALLFFLLLLVSFGAYSARIFLRAVESSESNKSAIPSSKLIGNSVNLFKKNSWTTATNTSIDQLKDRNFATSYAKKTLMKINQDTDDGVNGGGKMDADSWIRKILNSNTSIFTLPRFPSANTTRKEWNIFKRCMSVEAMGKAATSEEVSSSIALRSRIKSYISVHGGVK